MIRLLTIPAILTGLVVGAVFWSGAAGQSDRADFAFINRDDNKSLDLANMSWMQDIRLAYALWEGLYTPDPVTLKPILGCADRADVDPTHTIWTFHIRPDARWSNGDYMKAGDFLFSWRRFLENPGEYTYLHYYIKGARQYAEDYAAYVDKVQNGDKTAQPPDISTVGEKALNDSTLQVTLTDPVPFFPALCAFPPFFPMHEASMQPFKQVDKTTGLTTGYDEHFTRPPFLVSNGPYRMAEWTFKRRIRMIASDYYWDRANVKSRVIDQLFYSDPLAQLRAFERGDVDWVAEVEVRLAADLQDNHMQGLHVFNAFGTYFYSFNCLPTLPGGRPNPLTDVRVRRALSMAIDKKQIVEDAGRLNQPIALQYIPPRVFEDYDSPPGLPYDLDAARKLLADAGYPDGKGFPRLNILYNTDVLHSEVAQIIHRQWLNNLNIDTDLAGCEVKVFGLRLHTQDYDIARASWYGDYDDPSTFTDKYKSDSDDNDSKWNSPEYDAICAAAQKEPDPHKRFALLSKAEAILLQDAPIIPLFHYVNAYLFRDNVQGIPLDPREMVNFKAIQVVH
jgi:oligopeptide transport system substrate-binding protein